MIMHSQSCLSCNVGLPPPEAETHYKLKNVKFLTRKGKQKMWPILL